VDIRPQKSYAICMKISTPAVEGQFQAAKWLKVQALLDGVELEQLLKALMPHELFPLSGTYGLEQLPLKSFVSEYSAWIEQLQRGVVPQPTQKALCLTRDPESVWLQQMPNDLFAVKPCRPYIQVQVHYMQYSPVDGQFRSMTFGPETIFWGLQFAFPQVFQDPKSGQFVDEDLGPNEGVFRDLRRWVREHTTPTPMLVDSKQVNLPVRLGKHCKSWIHQHPQLKARGLYVA